MREEILKAANGDRAPLSEVLQKKLEEALREKRASLNVKRESK